MCYITYDVYINVVVSLSLFPCELNLFEFGISLRNILETEMSITNFNDRETIKAAWIPWYYQNTEYGGAAVLLNATLGNQVNKKGV